MYNMELILWTFMTSPSPQPNEN